MDDKKRSGRPEGSPYHIPVLLDETIKAMNIRDDGIYLDATAGGGGHSFEIASRLTTGRLIALDQDPDAVKEASRRLEGLNAEVVRSNFAMMEQVLHDRGIFSVDGILMDIGVSSHQLDAPERGFSYHADAPLDMRMSQEGTTAAELVNTLDEKQLAEIFFRFGEEKYARPIARSIVRERVGQPIETTAMLSEIVKNSVPASYRRDGHPARKVFQALRIAVNRELDCLSLTLDTAFSLLKNGGRLAVITFHSLEDRMVKQRFALWCKGCVCPPDFPICVCNRTPAARLVLRKPVEASQEELEKNARSRSAKLRCIEKIHEPD
ncbi:MAG: 16S rRNA (cytosine(1402)-N(4))-methyltransferase RsmH [Clostridiales bacterium]|jgi:16S rRNA (cytosine1402-N4)-methyltransferase|nr:16S rRNA (cytosine(1402)-N(4))-methyltransferase RsmH [Clostridiales bacterium]